MHSAFDPASPQAHLIASLWWWMLGVGGTIWIIVIATMFYVSFTKHRHREPDDPQHVSEATHRRMERAVIAAGLVTVLVLTVFLGFDYSVGHALAQHPQRALTINVTGHQWWWEAEYEDPDPSKRITTANEIHVPVGQPVQFKLRAADVIHSFWVPNLNGKRDLIPGYVSSQWFRADTAGVYRGQCAEFCGLQHAKMALYIVAEPPAKFAAWMAAAAQSPPPPADSARLYGQRVFLSSGCAVCHTIGGTQAQAFVGPPLTHLKSRATIAAGTLTNTRANLMGWITNPQAIKPGVRMPAYPLTPLQLEALVDYLETLK
ncbi:MAG TPA: cytochrome c oxidase subunit II [Gemmatimonadaceae bacterium]|jgi:cytochrome c oxidase subunit 2|nr:cytochrome c oxidase subunit II [Gemmatimonadaceae bacterium]